jgi:cobyrinic acid a,c-diamide synthase
MKAIIIAAPQSGSGKTTITLGIMECLKRRGLVVAPFKVGPDFIDPGYHRFVTGHPSINLDGWMCGPRFVQETFARHSAAVDIAVIEGVMGLFDGIGGNTDEGSTAQIAKLTGSPVILVIDAKGLARSGAAIVKGFAEFDPELVLAGVIFNNVASENHGRMLQQSVEAALPGLKVLGCVPRDEKLHIPSRHLGLMTADENPLPQEFLDHLVEVIRGSVDLGLLWTVATSHSLEIDLPDGEEFPAVPQEKVRIAVARDSAFCFVYEDNLRLLREAGGEIVTFSPLRNEQLPPGVGGVYLPGGYPEVFSETLAANLAVKDALRAAIEAGMPVYAECGGFVYLTRGVIEGEVLFPFVGVYPVTTIMLPRRKALGYREIETVGATIIGPARTLARGHEFHYSEMAAMPETVVRNYRVSKNGLELGMEGYGYKNCLASYNHLHFGSCPGLARSFVAKCRSYLQQQ